MLAKTVDTFTATIYVGLKRGYSNFVHSYADAIKIVTNFTNKVQIGVTVTPTHFYYVSGDEPGLIIGFINYPRFPSTPEEIERKVIELVTLLHEKLEQYRITVVFPTKTIMFDFEKE